MHIHNLYVYPVKSLRPIALNSTQISSLGPLHDRIFMLQHESPPATPEGGPSYRNMHITHYPQLSLLQPAFHPSLPSFLIRYNPAVPEESSVEFEIPLTPETDGLARREINMHNSSCTGYDMGDSYAAFFTTCLGFPTRLIYLGPSRRPVLGSVVPQTNTGLLSFIPSFIPINRSPKAGISFADCAPLLITTRSSLNAVSEMLPGGEEMDITKFRPNVVLDADSEDELKPWEEDFWGEIQIAGHRVVITANCARCKSINVSSDLRLLNFNHLW